MVWIGTLFAFVIAQFMRVPSFVVAQFIARLGGAVTF